MRVVGAIMIIMLALMTCNSTSSSGWEYLGMLNGFGFKSSVCHLCVILIAYYFNNKRLGMMIDNTILDL